MKSESLRNIRTLRQVKSSLEVAGRQNFKTLGSMSRPQSEFERLEYVGLDNNQTEQILARENARAAKFECSVERSQRKLLRSREKIAGLVNRNRALTNLRHQIQKDRDQKKSTLLPATTAPQPGTLESGHLHGIELKY